MVFTYGRDLRDAICLALYEICQYYNTRKNYKYVDLSDYNDHPTYDHFVYVVSDGTPETEVSNLCSFTNMYYGDTEIQSVVNNNCLLYNNE